MPVSQDDFRAALSRFASGVTVVTTKDTNGRLHGITVSAFCSVSLEPPLVLVCIEKTTASHYAFEDSGFFTVNFLNDDQSELSEHFATELENKFDSVPTMSGSNGLPVIEGSVAVLECRLRSAHDEGDHTIFVGEVENANLGDRDPVVYFLGEYRKLED